jgi:hypothetical protein
MKHVLRRRVEQVDMAVEAEATAETAAVVAGIAVEAEAVEADVTVAVMVDAAEADAMADVTVTAVAAEIAGVSNRTFFVLDQN